MKVVIAAMLRTYDLRPDGSAHELPKRRNITIRPGGGSHVRLAGRTADAEGVPA
jgi:hypothetical protein